MSTAVDVDESTVAPRDPRWLQEHRRWFLALAATVLFLGLTLLASLPTGGDHAVDAVPSGSRLAARQPLDDGDVVIQILSTQGRLSAQVAYRGPKGWLAARLDDVADDTVAAWAATPGTGPVPALSLVFGRAVTNEVEVTWDDGTVSGVVAARDGVFVVARAGRHTSASVVMRDGTGATVLEVEGP